MKSIFSEGERKVLDEFSKLFIQKEIADNLSVTRSTVNSHISNIKNKIYDYTGQKISTKEELMIFLLCEKAGKNFDLEMIKKEGLDFLFK